MWSGKCTNCWLKSQSKWKANGGQHIEEDDDQRSSDTDLYQQAVAV